MSIQTEVVVSVFIIKNGRFLAARRKNSHFGYYAIPGGKLTPGESFEECGRRETLEESGISCNSFVKLDTLNLVYADIGKQYIITFLVATDWEGNALYLEPEKMECWEWIDASYGEYILDGTRIVLARHPELLKVL